MNCAFTRVVDVECLWTTPAGVTLWRRRWRRIANTHRPIWSCGHRPAAFWPSSALRSSAKAAPPVTIWNDQLEAVVGSRRVYLPGLHELHALGLIELVRLHSAI